MNRFSRQLQGLIVGSLAWVAICCAKSLGAAEQLATLEGHTARITSIAYSPDGKTLASGSADRTIKLWDVSESETKERATLSGHEDEISCVAFSSNGEILASASADKTIRLWDTATHK